MQLTAAYNPLQPWLDAFNTASANAGRIGEAFSEAPAVLLQQFLANQISHVGAILQNPGNIGAVIQDVGQNVKSAITAATLLGTKPEDWTIAGSNDVWHGLVAQMLPNMLPTAGNPQASAIVTQVVNVLASPLSGVLMGLVGPGISPVVALVNSITKIATSLAAGDAMTAAQAAINIPAAMVNGFLNGANLNLDVLAPLITKTMPAGNELQKLNIQFGGLFTAGVTGMDMTGIGGSILNSLGLTAETVLAPGFPLEITGQGIGPIGALVNLSHLLAKAIGWSGTGNPLAPKAAADPAAATQVSVTKAATDNS
ncbi:outer membrane porin GjpA, partial [Mycolicibacterium sp. NCC-Tsukiji]|uniref:outer membrane porin GjpA n=2 Tax=Mycobacteriaceae TaxID=1762 RepID=UPI001FCF2149